MSRTRIHRTVMACGFVLLGLQAAFAANSLETIGVSREDDSVVVRISTSAGCEYNVFLTESKPERIVIDLSGVINDMPEKQFLDLPTKSIRSIRTSQYKTAPDLQARVVLDIGRPVDFRNYRDGDVVIVKIPAISGEAQFASWESESGELTGDEPVMQPAEEKAEAGVAEPIQVQAASPEPMAVAQVALDDPPVAQGIQVDTAPKRKTVEYAVNSLRDPFAPLVGAGAGKVAEGLPSLENLKLVGILEDNKMNRALLEDGEGNGYILKPNDRVQSGYLVTVTDNKAIFQVTEYGWTRTVALELEVPDIK